MHIDLQTARRFSVAPMLDWTNLACRRLHRLFCPQALLYSEMISTGAIVHADPARYLQHSGDMPCALQLGGGNPEELARATAIAQDYAYAEINLNVGCPSDRVQNHRIGACLMDSPHWVAKCLQAMQKESDVPVSVKHRLGIDAQDERQVIDFVDCLANESDCRVFIVHARKAWLQGLSPKENREIPPLNYDLVYELKARFPQLCIVMNGGITSIEQANAHLAYVDGVMLGRAAYHEPYLLLQAAQLFDCPVLEVENLLPAIENLLLSALQNGEKLSDYTRHLLGLFNGRKGAKQFRRILSEEGRGNAGIEIWQQALQAVLSAGI